MKTRSIPSQPTQNRRVWQHGLRPVVRTIALHVRGAWYRAAHPGRTLSCNYCGYRAGAFIPDGARETVFDDKRIVGGGFREHVHCPRCNATDRERLLRIAIERHIQLPAPARILHGAPERNLNGFLKSLPGAQVAEFDLDPDTYSWNPHVRKEDLTKLSFEDGVFDLVVCNHVLEHIPDDSKAMREVFRVLKTGGRAILQVPYSDSIPATDEDFSITSPEERLRRFGQNDHVRIYQRADYIRRVEAAGFRARFIEPAKFKADAAFAISSREGVLLFEKPAGNSGA